jgi:hypothetical protein
VSYNERVVFAEDACAKKCTSLKRATRVGRSICLPSTCTTVLFSAVRYLPFYRVAVLGDPRINQNPALLSFGVLFFKWHNLIASRVQKDNPEWSDEEVFQKTRRLVIATLQVTHHEPRALR